MWACACESTAGRGQKRAPEPCSWNYKQLLAALFGYWKPHSWKSIKYS